MILLLLVSALAVPATSPPSAVEVMPMVTSQEQRPSILVKLAPNWLRVYNVEPQAYMASLKAHLAEMWPDATIRIVLGPELPQIGVVEVKDSKDIDSEIVLGEVSDHFDEYE